MESTNWTVTVTDFLYYHLITICVILAISLTISIRRYGTNKNKQIAEQQHKILSPIIKQYFKKNHEQLIYESPNIIKIYPSDRQSCPFAIISMALIPRQQLLSFFFNWIIFKLKDQLVIQIPVNNQHPLSLTCAIVQRKNIRTITKKSFPDIKQLCKQYKPIKKQGEQEKKNVPQTHCILVQRVDHVNYFLETRKDVEIWKQYGKHVKLVYISDVNKFSRYPMAVRMVMGLNNKDVPHMIDWLMCFVDKMAKARQGISEYRDARKKRETLDITYD